MTDPVAIAVSGGIDSLVCAHLLQKRGHDIWGVHFLTGFENSGDPSVRRIRQLFKKIGVPVRIINLAKPFSSLVVDYFTKAYHEGRTPSPCLICNPTIKFGVLFETVRQLGATFLATGHYARVVPGPDGRFRLKKGMDEKKDQSYFLSRLSQDQLARARFPLGEWTKAAVLRYAKKNGLQPAVQKESQDVCFIKGRRYIDFLVESGAVLPQPGEITDAAGNRIGTHKGLHRYTIGQRRGINCPAKEAYYVLAIDPERNRLVVGQKNQLYAIGCRITDINWIGDRPAGQAVLDLRIRYRHKAVASTVTVVGATEATVRFHDPQAAVTPGQGAVFYRGDEVVGGGWIASM